MNFKLFHFQTSNHSQVLWKTYQAHLELWGKRALEIQVDLKNPKEEGNKKGLEKVLPLSFTIKEILEFVFKPEVTL